MRNLLRATIFGLSMGLMAASGASAMPANGAVISSVDNGAEVGAVIQVGWRCGFDRHWSYRWHRCVFNWR